jgi:hypothetical protein
MSFSNTHYEDRAEFERDLEIEHEFSPDEYREFQAFDHMFRQADNGSVEEEE